jgi:anti-sigma factor RsiW
VTHLVPDQFDLYLDDRLDPAQRAAAEAHLAACPACRAELAALRDMLAMLEALPPERLPADLTGPVLARIAPAANPWPQRLALAAFAAQVVIALALSAWLVPALLAGPLSIVGPMLPAWPERGPGLVVPPEAVALVRAGVAPLAALGLGQWALILALAGAAWLITNRLLLQGLARARRPVRVPSR